MKMKYTCRGIRQICFILLFTNLVLRCSGQKYHFSIETIELVRPVTVYEVGVRAIAAHPLSQLSPDQQSSLCARAREYALIDRRDPSLGGMEMGVDMFGFCLEDSTVSNLIALLCPSIPLIYLYLPNKLAVNKIWIMLRRNQYMDEIYTFWPRFVHKVDRVGGYDEEVMASVRRALTLGASTLESLKDLPHLVYRSNMERRDMCIAARKRAWPSSAVIVSDSWTQVAEKYQFFDIALGNKIVAAISCNSVPPIYLWVEENAPQQFYATMMSYRPANVSQPIPLSRESSG